MELNALEHCDTEEDLIKALEIVDDKVRGVHYSQTEALLIADALIQYDLAAFKYAAKEEILYVLSELTAYYRFNGGLDETKIASAKDDLEDDLKEYVEEILENIRH